ncbi:MAG TPA: carboxymuconolactone decarboxylase family protein [Pseudonocardiaceae bacterium]|nr:carboxymuconolactone decarboxylase family protein [Pseudonocardiaceae bacterium]
MAETTIDLLASVRAEAERDYGALVPPIAVHSPTPKSLVAVWAMLRATMIEPGAVDRTTKEAVATAVSHANSCWYNEELHLTTLESLNEQRAASAGGELGSLADLRIRKATAWARTAGMRGYTETRRPFDDRQVPELVGTVVLTHYLDRIAMTLATGADATRLDQVAARALHSPGPAADPPLTADLPGDLAWAAGEPIIANAFARAAIVIDAGADRSVPVSVRALTQARLADWQGETPDDDQHWLAVALAGLPDDDRPAGRLALLTAFAPRQVTALALDMFREDGTDERALVELISWASFTAARRVGEWLAPSVRPAVTESSGRVLEFRGAGDAPRRSAGRTRQRRAGV